MTFRSRPISSPPAARRISHALSIALVTLLIAGMVVSAQETETSTPAQGRTQVVALGMSARPALRSSWRVTVRDIPSRADARPSDRLEGSSGFLLADAGAIFVADQDTKLRYRLAPGEAIFVPIGANQTWASLDGDATTAYTVELADRERADEVVNGELLFRSGSFGMEEGDYDMDLLRDVLPYNSRTRIAEGEFPVVLLVTSGQIEVTSDREGEEVTRLTEGEAGSFSGNLRIRGRSERDAVFVAGIVAPAIGGGRTSAQPTPTPTEEPEDEPTEEPTEAPTEEATEEPDADETEEATEEAGDEPSAEPTEEAARDADESEDEQEEDAAARRTGSAEVRLQIRLCPEGMRPETLNASACTRAKGDWSLQLRTPDNEPLRLSDANRYDDDYIRWSGLEPGTYQLLVRKIPEGYDISSLDGYLCCAGGLGYQLVLTDDLSVLGTLYFFKPRPVAAAVSQPASGGANPAGDNDGDGVPNQQEIDFYGTSPNLRDSDGDTIPDGVEAYGTNGYLTAPSLPDTDSDGFNDNVEIARGTNPLNPNSRPPGR